LFCFYVQRSNTEVLGSEILILKVGDGQGRCMFGSGQVFVVFGRYATAADKVIRYFSAAASDFLDCEVIGDG
jgi:hypothetical protein